MSIRVSAADGDSQLREAVQSLLSPSEPGDALASYYALWHDPRRTRLTVHYDDAGEANGFISISQTGADLFRQLVTLRAPDSTVVQELLEKSLVPHRPYQIIAPVGLASYLRDHLELSQVGLEGIYSLLPSGYQPIINVLVQRVAGPDGAPRYQIEAQGEVVALAGTNWRSPTFAEVFVYVHPRGRGRGWGQSVVSACVSDLLAERLRPLYMARKDDAASIHLAEALGFADSGSRQVTGQAFLNQ